MNSGNVIRPEEKIDFRRFGSVVKKKIKTIIYSGLVITGLTTLVVFIWVATYNTPAEIAVLKPSSSVLSHVSSFGLDESANEYIYSQVKIIESNKIARQVIRRFDLNDNPTFWPKPLPFGLQYLVDSAISAAKYVASFLPKNNEPVGIPLKDRGYSKGDVSLRKAVKEFSKNLDVKIVKKSQLIKIKYDSRSPGLAAALANAVATAYISSFVEAQAEYQRNLSRALSERLAQLRNDVTKAEQRLQNYLKKNNLLNVKDVGSLAENRATELASKVDTLRQNLSTLRQTYGPKHPKILAAQSELKTAERALAVSRMRLQSAANEQMKINDMQSDIDAARKLYDTFIDRVRVSSEASKLDSPIAMVVDPAVPLKDPTMPLRLIFISCSFPAGLVLSALFLIILDMVNSPISSKEDVTDKLHSATLGLLPVLKAREGKLPNVVSAMVEAVNASFAEAMGSIRTGIILSGLDRTHKVLLITSSVAGEGKTTAAMSLAISMSRLEKVLLIDADMRDPSIGKWSGIDPTTPGLSEAIAGVTEIQNCIIAHERLGADLITAGQLPPNPLELLSSHSFGELLANLEQQYDRIIIDSPSVTNVSDALVLAQYAKSIVYVVKADSTPAKLANEGMGSLLHGAPVAGVVLNMVNAVETAGVNGKELNSFQRIFIKLGKKERHQGANYIR